jgi:intracellular sulfur oxidation DsrE/DsrF family protein
MNAKRGEFLAAAVVGAAVLADVRGADAAVPAPYDRREMNAILDRPGRHHHIIGSPRINAVAALRSAAHIMGAYEFAMGEGPGTVAIIVSLYGPSSILMLVNDAFWAKSKAYELAQGLDDLPPQVLRGSRNPFYHARSTMSLADDPSDVNGFWHDYTVEALTRRGVKWFICTEALRTASRELAQLGDGEPDAIFADLRAHLLPGALVVPSGSQALVIAQERHYTYHAA